MDYVAPWETKVSLYNKIDSLSSNMKDIGLGWLTKYGDSYDFNRQLAKK